MPHPPRCCLLREISPVLFNPVYSPKVASVSISQAFNPLGTESIKIEIALLWGEEGCALLLGLGCRAWSRMQSLHHGGWQETRKPLTHSLSSSPAPTPPHDSGTLCGPPRSVPAPTPRSAAGTALAPSPHIPQASIFFVTHLGSRIVQEEGGGTPVSFVPCWLAALPGMSCSVSLLPSSSAFLPLF